jgi:hypothetical protein
MTKADFDPFDVPSLSDDEAFSDVAAEEETLSVPVKKPGKEHFFRVNPDPAMTMVARVLSHTAIDQLSPTLYWLDTRKLQLEDIADSIQAKRLYVCMYRGGGMFVWPASLPDPNSRGNGDRWANSALKVATRAKTEWVRMVPETLSIGGYRMLVARGEYPDPVWPDRTLSETLKIAFADQFIDSMDHPVIRDKLGE